MSPNQSVNTKNPYKCHHTTSVRQVFHFIFISTLSCQHFILFKSSLMSFTLASQYNTLITIIKPALGTVQAARALEIQVLELGRT